jgi:hypothetical protein
MVCLRTLGETCRSVLCLGDAEAGIEIRDYHSCWFYTRLYDVRHQ